MRVPPRYAGAGWCATRSSNPTPSAPCNSRSPANSCSATSRHQKERQWGPVASSHNRGGHLKSAEISFSRKLLQLLGVSVQHQCSPALDDVVKPKEHSSSLACRDMPSVDLIFVGWSKTAWTWKIKHVLAHSADIPLSGLHGQLWIYGMNICEKAS